MFYTLEKKKFKYVNYRFKLKGINLFFKKKKFLKYYIKNNIFTRIYFLLNKLNINTKFFFNILFTYFKFYWFFYLKTSNIINYYKLLIVTFLKYFNLFKKKYNLKIYTNNNVYYPNSILNNLRFNSTDIKSYNLFYIYNIEKYFFKKLLKNTKILKNKIVRNKYIIHNIIYKNKNYGKSDFKLNFLRIQRRYNKRRYSKVRISSRNSFFAGISFSSIFLAILWGGSIKNVDWLTSKIIVVDINFIILTLFVYFFYRVSSVMLPSIFLRRKNKIKTTNTFINLFILDIWYKK